MADGNLPIEDPMAAEEPMPVEAEAAIGTEDEGSSLNLTVEDIPELADLKVGDEITFRVGSISEDGSYAVVAMPPMMAEEAAPPEMPMAEEPAAGGRDAVLNELIG